MWITSSWTKKEKKKEKKRWSQCKRTIFFNMYIVHEHLVEENVLTKTYLLANKIYCMYIPTAFSLTQGGTSHKASEVYHMTFNAVNHVNFLSNNKWQAHATLNLAVCVWFTLFGHSHHQHKFWGERLVQEKGDGHRFKGINEKESVTT